MQQFPATFSFFSFGGASAVYEWPAFSFFNDFVRVWLKRQKMSQKGKKCCWLDIFATCSNLPFYFKTVLVIPITRPLFPHRWKRKKSIKKRKGKWREETSNSGSFVRGNEHEWTQRSFYRLSYLGNLFLLTTCFSFYFADMMFVSLQVQKAIQCLVSYCCAIRSFEQKRNSKSFKKNYTYILFIHAYE